MMSKDKKVVAIIQARMTSSRLPGKVMREIAGYPMIYHVIHRVGLSTLVDKVVVATTTDNQDDEIAQFCKENNIFCFRGHPYDVLDRYYQTAVAHQADVVVRITADCPLMDPELIDELVNDFLGSEVDFVFHLLRILFSLSTRISEPQDIVIRGENPDNATKKAQDCIGPA